MDKTYPISIKLELYSSEEEYLRNSALELARLLHRAKINFEDQGTVDLAERMKRCRDTLMARYGLETDEVCRRRNLS